MAIIYEKFCITGFVRHFRIYWLRTIPTRGGALECHLGREFQDLLSRDRLKTGFAVKIQIRDMSLQCTLRS